MGTRHLICVVKNGEYKVSQYGQWDGYPEGQGIDILNFLTAKMDRKAFDSKVTELTYISDEEYDQRWKKIGIDLEECGGWVNADDSARFYKLYPELNRDTGSNILAIIQDSETPLKLKSGLDFAGDSLFCEWAYVIDLDKNTFEVYKGFNQEPIDPTERFAAIAQTNEEYHPVKHAETFDLNSLPTNEEFLNTLKKGI